MAGIKSNDRKIQRVPLLLLEKKKNSKYYQPKVVSIGPYHHRQDPKLTFVDAFKPIALDWFVSDKGKELYYNNILEIITDIRNHYERDPSIKKYLDDDAYAKMMKYLDEDDYLAEMMLRDAAFIIVHMEMAA